MVKDFKDDINKETAVMDRTHGPLGLPRLTDLTIGQRRVGDFFDRHYSPREDRGEDPPLCVRSCVFPILRYKHVVVVSTGRVFCLSF